MSENLEETGEQPSTYLVLMGGNDDLTGRRIEIGETIAAEDFAPETLAAWLEMSAITPVASTDEPEEDEN